MACVKCQEVCKLFLWLFCGLIYSWECGTQKNILVRQIYFGCNLLRGGREENSTRLREKFTIRFGLLMGFTAICQFDRNSAWNLTVENIFVV